MKQQTLISEVEIVYRTKIRASDRLQVKCSKDAYDILLSNWDLDTIEHHESFKVLLLNRSNKVLGVAIISQGGTNATLTDLKIIFQYAIKSNAAGIIVSHNHPSGNINPSESDTKITQKIKEAGNILEVQLLDHLIITNDDNYYSFADNGLL
jgi:DNA repair protein RadC